MPRTMTTDDAVYRAVITITYRTGSTVTRTEGPYGTRAAAARRVTQALTDAARIDATVTGHVETATTVWHPHTVTGHVETATTVRRTLGDPPAPDLATIAAAYRQAADLIETSGELRDYTGGHMNDILKAAAFLRRRADELHPTEPHQ